MRLLHPDDPDHGSLRRPLAAWALLAITGAGLIIAAAKLAWAIRLNS